MSSSSIDETPLSLVLPGTWRLLSRIDTTPSGAVVDDPALGSDPIALLVYDRSGNFAAQFMKRDRSGTAEVPATKAENNTQAQGGYDAYFGTYSVDDSSGRVTQRLMASLAPANVGMELTRAMEVRGDTLTITLETTAADGEPVTRTLTWRRLSALA